MGWADRQGLLLDRDFAEGEPDSLHLLPGTGANSHKPLGMDHKPTRQNFKCQAGRILQVETACGSWRYLWMPCNKWSCQKCSYYRLHHELKPEIAEALQWARELGETAKFLTFTWRRGTPGAMPTSEGAKLRTLNLQHIVQWMRRRYGIFEYLRISESHKSGAVHLHMVAVSAYIPQALLSIRWEKETQGSRIVDVEAIGMPCPRCWPGHHAPRKEKRASMIVPPPGRGECRRCGYSPDWSLQEPWDEVSHRASQEIAKYLTKATPGTIGTRKCMNRSRAWGKRCQVARPDKPGECSCCQAVHTVKYVGVEGQLRTFEDTLVRVMLEGNIAFYAPGRGPCDCFGEGVHWSCFGRLANSPQFDDGADTLPPTGGRVTP